MAEDNLQDAVIAPPMDALEKAFEDFTNETGAASSVTSEKLSVETSMADEQPSEITPDMYNELRAENEQLKSERDVARKRQGDSDREKQLREKAEADAKALSERLDSAIEENDDLQDQIDNELKDTDSATRRKELREKQRVLREEERNLRTRKDELDVEAKTHEEKLAEAEIIKMRGVVFDIADKLGISPTTLREFTELTGATTQEDILKNAEFLEERLPTVTTENGDIKKAIRSNLNGSPSKHGLKYTDAHPEDIRKGIEIFENGKVSNFQ